MYSPYVPIDVVELHFADLVKQAEADGLAHRVARERRRRNPSPGLRLRAGRFVIAAGVWLSGVRPVTALPAAPVAE